MKHVFSSFLSLGVLLLSACSQLSEANYSNRGTPESLLDVSVEQITVPLDGAAGIDDLIAVLNQNQPSQATLQCAGNDMLCRNARNVLQQFAVPATEMASAGGNQVVLVYENLVARDCDPRFVDNTINPYNLNHPSFGCANASNMIQMVGDKRQFTNPVIHGYVDGSKVRQGYKEYVQPAKEDEKTSSILSDVTSN